MQDGPPTLPSIARQEFEAFRQFINGTEQTAQSTKLSADQRCPATFEEWEVLLARERHRRQADFPGWTVPSRAISYSEFREFCERRGAGSCTFAPSLYALWQAVQPSAPPYVPRKWDYDPFNPPG